MDIQKVAAARACLAAAEHNTLHFPEIVGRLMAAGFEGYAIDLRRAAATYYLPDGESLDLPIPPLKAPVAAVFDPGALRTAIREAQEDAPGYSYAGFRRKAATAGCASYVVSFPGRRVVYIGRAADTHVELFPA
ncbi:DUF1398 domain-containing protein [Xanthobacter sp. V4C-4]|uniref:DUF1398 domain-containing protein n=1 Tax=Xanthobacter cornucopiae TaxID=3119924 RepID=UPI003729270A